MTPLLLLLAAQPGPSASVVMSNPAAVLPKLEAMLEWGQNLDRTVNPRRAQRFGATFSIDPLDPASIAKAGFDITQPWLADLDGQRRLGEACLSLPLADPKRFDRHFRKIAKSKKLVDVLEDRKIGDLALSYKGINTPAFVIARRGKRAFIIDTARTRTADPIKATQMVAACEKVRAPRGKPPAGLSGTPDFWLQIRNSDFTDRADVVASIQQNRTELYAEFAPNFAARLIIDEWLAKKPARPLAVPQANTVLQVDVQLAPGGIRELLNETMGPQSERLARLLAGRNALVLLDNGAVSWTFEQSGSANNRSAAVMEKAVGKGDGRISVTKEGLGFTFRPQGPKAPTLIEDKAASPVIARLVAEPDAVVRALDARSAKGYFPHPSKSERAGFGVRFGGITQKTKRVEIELSRRSQNIVLRAAFTIRDAVTPKMR